MVLKEICNINTSPTDYISVLKLVTWGDIANKMTSITYVDTLPGLTIYLSLDTFARKWKKLHDGHFAIFKFLNILRLVNESSFDKINIALQIAKNPDRSTGSSSPLSRYCFNNDDWKKVEHTAARPVRSGMSISSSILAKNLEWLTL